MEVTLYTTHCPKCKVLEAKLQQKNIDYKVIDDEQLMIEKGFMEAPQLEVDDDLKDFSDAINWLKTI